MVYCVGRSSFFLPCVSGRNCVTSRKARIMSESLYIVCQQCGKDVPQANITTHRLRCRASARPSPPPPPSPAIVDLTQNSPVVSFSRPPGITDRPPTRTSPPVLSMRTSTAPQRTTSASPPLPPPPFEPLSPPMAPNTSGEHWSCPFCTFQNELGNEVCGMCFKSPEDGEVTQDDVDVLGRVGRVSISANRGAHSMQGVRNRGTMASRFSGAPFFQRHEPPTGAAGGVARGGRARQGGSTAGRGNWACPICTFENRRGVQVCEACETGRPRREDMEAMDMLSDDEDDGFVVLPSQGRGRQGATRGGVVDRELMTLQNILDGAILGAGAGGAHAMLTGRTPAQARQNVFQSMLLGGIGGGLFGNHVRAAFGGMSQPDIDRMSYEDMLEMFGPGHVPEKASVESVTSLPITIMTDTELARLQRPDVQEGKDCLVCMEDFVKGDEMKMLPCTHRFHTHCIDKWLTQCANTCPVCNFRFEGGGEG